jgi:hypothetical protein
MQAMSRTADTLGRDDQRRERLNRVLARLNRLHEPAYGERIPSHNSLYNWSPASEGEDHDQLNADRERRNRTHTSRFLNHNPSSQNESSLRSNAILQAVRRHPRFAARSREYMQRYAMDRSDRWAVESDELRPRVPEESRSASLLPPIPPRSSESLGSHQSSTRPRMRRAILQDPSCDTSGPSSSEWLGQTISYLASLRSSNSYEDSLGHAVDAGFVTKEFFGDRHDDFILDVNSLSPTFQTSLLAPGTILEGQQRANPEIANTHNSQPRRWEQDWRWDASNPRRDHLPRLTLDDTSRHSTSNVPPHAQRAQRTPTDKLSSSDSWPVKVTIHAVNYERMTMAATMEAYDVPSHPPDPINTIPFVPEPANPNITYQPNEPSTRTNSRGDGSKKKSITTYLEGEILDFRKHTLLTESFTSNPENDATYWRKLEPFRHFTDEELIRRLVSKDFVESLSRSYILMRWKERCFVRDAKDPANEKHRHLGGSSNWLGDGQDWYDSAEMADGCGLTISGFYYVCLRRADGSVEGLYCDPHSSPYQHLTLERKQKSSQFPVWEFK